MVIVHVDVTGTRVKVMGFEGDSDGDEDSGVYGHEDGGLYK